MPTRERRPVNQSKRGPSQPRLHVNQLQHGSNGLKIAGRGRREPVNQSSVKK